MVINNLLWVDLSREGGVIELLEFNFCTLPLVGHVEETFMLLHQLEVVVDTLLDHNSMPLT